MAENGEMFAAAEETLQDEVYRIHGQKVILNVDIDAEIMSYGVETKFNDYIGMQKPLGRRQEVEVDFRYCQES